MTNPHLQEGRDNRNIRNSGSGMTPWDEVVTLEINFPRVYFTLGLCQIIMSSCRSLFISIYFTSARAGLVGNSFSDRQLVLSCKKTVGGNSASIYPLIGRLCKLARLYQHSYRDVAMHGLWGGWSPPPNIAPPNKMKPICPFGLGLMFFARFFSKKTKKHLIKFDLRFKISLLKLQPKLDPPPNQKSWLRPCIADNISTHSLGYINYTRVVYMSASSPSPRPFQRSYNI